MKDANVEMIKNVVNCPVVKVKGREYPGVVLQGDTLYSLYSKSEKILASGKLDDTTYDYDAAEFLRDSLKEILSVYEQVLAEKGIELPYVKS